MRTKLSDIRIVLLNTYHSGNIGSAIRAMKTMGLTELVLVNPRNFPAPEANSLAAGAADLLANVTTYSSLQDAIADRTQVFATSARQAHSSALPQVSAEQAAAWVKTHPNEKIAIIFGGERDGLSSAEIRQCQQLLFVPGNPDYSVLNVSSAVQIVCYELFKALANQQVEADTSTQCSFANQREISNFLSSTESLLKERGYINENQPTDTMRKFKGMVDKMEPTSQEINLLRGMHKALTRIPKV